MTPRGRLALEAGLAGQVVFVGVVVVAGLMQPGYSHLRHPISILGAVGSESFWVQNAGLVVVGAGMVAYGTALHTLPWARRAAVLVVVAGLGLLGSGLVPCDAGCVLPRGRFQSVRDGVHLLFATVGVAAAVCAPLAATAVPLRDTRLAHYRGVSTWFGVLGVAAAVFYVLIGERSDLAGLSQRVILAPVAVWLTVTALAALRTPGTGGRRRAARAALPWRGRPDHRPHSQRSDAHGPPEVAAPR